MPLPEMQKTPHARHLSRAYGVYKEGTGMGGTAERAMPAAKRSASGAQAERKRSASGARRFPRRFRRVQASRSCLCSCCAVRRPVSREGFPESVWVGGGKANNVPPISRRTYNYPQTFEKTKPSRENSFLTTECTETAVADTEGVFFFVYSVVKKSSVPSVVQNQPPNTLKRLSPHTEGVFFCVFRGSKPTTEYTETAVADTERILKIPLGVLPCPRQRLP